MSAIALSGGVLYVARGGRSLVVRCFDLAGRPLEAGFTWTPPHGGGVGVTALAVDEDRRLWVADRRAARVRLFHVFGALTHELLHPSDVHEDKAGHFARPQALFARGSSDDLELLVGSAGERRHGVQVFGPRGELLRSLRPGGEPHGRFGGITAVGAAGRFTLAAEARGPVHVWRDREFHFQFDPVARVGGQRVGGARGTGAAVRALAVRPDGSSILAFDGGPVGLGLFDGSGHLAHVLAHGAGPHADGTTSVVEPVGVCLAPPDGQGEERLAVLDRGGARLLLLDLDGSSRGEAFAIG